MRKKESSESGPKINPNDNVRWCTKTTFTKIEKIKEKMPPRPRELAAARAARALPRAPVGPLDTAF